MAEHYSYRVYRSEKTAARFDEEKFGGEIGLLIQESQQKILFEMIPDARGKRILDLGAGTGRISIPMAKAGAQVYAADASIEMITVAKNKANEEFVKMDFIVGDAHDLPFRDSSFDVVVSFRMLLHLEDYKKGLSEICRVARKFVILDFPPKNSLVCLEPFYLTIKKKFCRNIQDYMVFSTKEISEKFEKEGFRISMVKREFLLPLKFYRKVGKRRFAEYIENLFRRAGLIDKYGAPVTIKAERI